MRTGRPNAELTLTAEARHTLEQWTRRPKTAQAPAELDVHLILDTDGTHKTAMIRRWLLKRPRVHVHVTPTSASWLNRVERWFALLTEKQWRREVHRNTQALRDALRAFITHTNEQPKPFVWTKTADEILASVARFRHRTSDSIH